MKKVRIAIDVDWTLRNNNYNDEVIANERIRTLLIILSSFKNVEIIVWSWGWELYARQVVRQMWLDLYVDKIIWKGYLWRGENWEHLFDPELQPDIAIDDIQDCILWNINLIVKEK